MSKGVVILPSYYEALKDLSDNDRLQMYDCIVRYGLYGELVDLPVHLRGYFKLIRPSVDSSRKRYDAACNNGEKGGAPLGNQNARKKKQPENNQTVNQRHNQDYDYDFDSEFEKDKEPGKGIEGCGEKGEQLCGVQMLDNLTDSDEDRLDRLRNTALDKLDKYMER